MATPAPEATPRQTSELISRLTEHALDLHWAWNHAGDAVWKHMNESLWARLQNPWLLMQYVSLDRLTELADDPEFLNALQALEDSRIRYHATPAWRPSVATSLPSVAYFSMEFGLHEALPLYAGGLGVLAGDFLKTASDLGVPLIGVGILWQQGYFRQILDAEGRQTELYPFNDPASLPLRPVIGTDGERLRVALNLPGRTILLRAWHVSVGRTTLYLLDSNDPINTAPDRGLTGTLYGGGTEARLWQEIILGLGGWRLLEELKGGIEICHLNEGHAAFVVIERARSFMERHHVTFREALWATRAGNVFTTHTAVPAGFDTFSIAEIEKHQAYFDEYVRRLGLSWPEFLALGRQNPDDRDEPFNMAWLAMRGCFWVNGVSQLHGLVSRRLFAGLYPRWPACQVPVGHVTNGVHVPSWDSPWTDALWTRAAGKERWRGDVSALAESMLGLSDEELWNVRARERHDLVGYVRERLARQLARHEGPEKGPSIARTVLQADSLTLGFARRFSSYKRPNLLLTDPDRLLRLLTNERRPVQLIVAGKAHPRDAESKQLVKDWVRFARSAAARAHVVFLDDYDMRLAVELVQGVDVWINTPRRPWEACGTSGMKVLVNGGLNVSVLDGWWAEAYASECDCGWAIGNGLEHADDTWDRRDAEQLYALLENHVVPDFYDRDDTGLPRRWIARMRRSMATFTPRFSSARMLQEYVERAYVPGAAALQVRSRDNARVARELDQWSRHVELHWSSIGFGPIARVALEGQLTVSVPVYLGPLAADVQVQLYADPDGPDPRSGAHEPLVFEMTAVDLGEQAGSTSTYRVTIETRRPPEHFTPRVVPFHVEARVPLEMGLVTWAR